MKTRVLPVLTALVALAACGDDDGVLVPVEGDGPQDLSVRYEWVAEGWPDGQVVGHPAVKINWNLSDAWRGEPFRVYSRESGASSYFLIATVTSCSTESSGFSDCEYTDLNVQPGATYDYYVAAVDESTGEEFETDEALQVDVPVFDAPNAPAALEVTALDGALFLQWPGAVEGDPEIWKYLVFLTELDGETTLYQVGETDGTVFLDERAENGFEYEYRVAALDIFGHASDLSVAASGIPRPDYHSEILYSSQDSVEASGFRFTTSAAESPVVAGTSTDAQFHIAESLTGALQLVPDGSTVVSDGVFTTSLACTAASEPDCVAVEAASTDATDYSSAPVDLLAGYTYVLRVVGDDGQTHYGKIRVQGSSQDGSSRTYVVFDWAYQGVAGEVRLNSGAR